MCWGWGVGVGRKHICWPRKWLLEDKETGPESSPASRPLCQGPLETRRWLSERMHSCRGQEDGRRGPELVFCEAPWCLESASSTLDSLFSLCHSNFWRRERALDSVCLCVCVTEPFPQLAGPKADYGPAKGSIHLHCLYILGDFFQCLLLLLYQAI